jgi:hypothetical protein
MTGFFILACMIRSPSCRLSSLAASALRVGVLCGLYLFNERGASHFDAPRPHPRPAGDGQVPGGADTVLPRQDAVGQQFG